jgi:Ca-activated chloride channel family protein
MDDSTLQFANPLWIFAGLLVCAGMVVVFIRFDRRREADLAKLVHPRFRERLVGGVSQRLRIFKRVLWLLSVLLLFVAIARPQKGYEWNEVKRRGIDILFAVDTSRSMLAEDLSPNRLERARLGILDFVDRLEGDRVGLIPFAGSAFALCPLTLDYDAFRESLAALDTDIIPRQGTNIASAIEEAGRLFDEQANNYRVLVLITDGEDLEGSVVDVAKAAAEKGMTIHTVGVGSPEGATIPVRLRNGRVEELRDAEGKVVRTSLDESTLKKIAEVTGGIHVSLGRGAEGLNTIYQERLRLVPKSELEQRMERIPLERFEWPLGLAILLLLLEFFTSDRRKAGKARALPKFAATLTGVLAISSTSDARADEVDPRKIYNQGTQAYLGGDFATANDTLRASLKTRDLKLQQQSYYNLGGTLYRTGQKTLEKEPQTTIKSWEEAIKAYEDSLALDPDDADALFNKEFVMRKLEELKKQQEQKEDKKDDKQEDKQEDQKDGKQGEKQDPKDQQKDSQDGKEPGEEQKDKGEESKDEPKPSDKKPEDEGKSGDKKEDKSEADSKPSEDGKEPKEEKEKPKEEGKDPKQEGKEADEDKGKPEDSAGSKASADKSGKEKPEGEGKAAGAEEKQERNEQMTPEEALQLIESLRNDERMVIPIPRRTGKTDNTTKGKTW